MEHKMSIATAQLLQKQPQTIHKQVSLRSSNTLWTLKSDFHVS